jgi:uncharacterized protein YndB with AHSA1/START domain
MAGRFDVTTVIDKPIDEVWAFLADGQNDKKFSARVLEIAKTTDGPVGVGTIYSSTVKDGGIKTKREIELTEFSPPTRMRWAERSSNPVVAAEGGYDLEAEGDSTKVTLFNVLEGRGAGKLITPIALRSARKGAPAFGEAIKAAVEAS